MKASTTFGEDPAAMARRWLDAGARRLHLVDLNGAFAGKPVNEARGQGHPARGRRRDSGAAGRRHPRPRHHRALPRRRHQPTSSSAPRRSRARASCATPAPPSAATSSSASTRRDGKVATDGWSKLTGHEVDRPGEEVRGLRRRRRDLHRHRPRRHAHRHQHRGHGQAGAGADDPGHRLAAGWPAWPTSNACARSRPTASKA